MRTRSHSKRAFGALLLFAVVVAAWGQTARTADGRGELALKDTIWVGKEQHRRVTVHFDGTIDIKEGKDIYVRFLDQIDDIFVIEVRWWNESAGITTFSSTEC